MCLVIDSCVFSKVFNKNDKKHFKFEPISEWILKGNGSVIYGGTKFANELGLKKLQLLKLLKDAGKAVSIENGVIDTEERVVSNLIPDTEDFDDPHIIALLRISKSRIICSDDKRMFPYIKDERLFKSRSSQPRIYQNTRNRRLISDQNIVNCCQKKTKLKKRSLDELVNRLNRI